MEMTGSRYAVAIAAIFAPIFAASDTARAVIIPVTADAQIQTSNAANPSDGQGNANAGVQSDTYVGFAGFSAPFKSLLRFDLTSIPANQVITSATLHLTPEFGTSITVDLHRLLVSWVEGDGLYGPPNSGSTGATWESRDKSGSNPWTSGGASSNGNDRDASAISFAATGSSDPAVNVLSDVALWYANPASNFGWVLDTQAVTGWVAYYTRENVDPARDPYLDVTFSPVPEPASAGLGLLATTALLWRRGRSQS